MDQYLRPAAPSESAPRGTPASSTRLFVVHAPEDLWFVDGFLLRELGLPDDDVLISDRLEPGEILLDELARGAQSMVTVVVLSPAFLASRWARVAEQLAQHHSLAEQTVERAIVVPALLVSCELPLLSAFRVPLDFRDPDRTRWQAEVARLHHRLASVPPPAVTLTCPYPGMRPFYTGEAARFHGRHREIDDLMTRLRGGERELYVIGPSGSGKSSLITAGLVPRLAEAPERAGGRYLVRSLRPGNDPVGALAAAMAVDLPGDGGGAIAVTALLAAHRDHDRVLLIIDQLEELFTLSAREHQSAFFEAIRSLRSDARIVLVFTLRADFYGALMDCSLWPELDGHLSRLDVGPLRGAALREAIEAPARSLGIYLDPALTDRLLVDAADEPGMLPLLQEVLVDLWDRRCRSLMRLADYVAIESGTGTRLATIVAGQADLALRALTPERQEVARRILLRLIQFGDGRANTRRSQFRAALVAVVDAPGELDAVIRHLVDRRLLTTDDEGARPRVDLAHEVLITAWPLLRDLIATRRQLEERRRALEWQTARWVEHGRGATGLLDRGELDELATWLDNANAREFGVGADMAALVETSREVVDSTEGRLEAIRFPAGLDVLTFEPRKTLVVKIHRTAKNYRHVSLVPIVGGLFALALWSHLGARAGNSWVLVFEIGIMFAVVVWDQVRTVAPNPRIEFDLFQRRVSVHGISLKSPIDRPRPDDVLVTWEQRGSSYRAHLLYAHECEVMRTPDYPTRDEAVEHVFGFATTLGHALGLTQVRVVQHRGLIEENVVWREGATGVMVDHARSQQAASARGIEDLGMAKNALLAPFSNSRKHEPKW